MKQSEHGGQILRIARQLGIPAQEILDFSASINPLGPAPTVRAAIMAAIDQVVHYPDSAATELQEALAVSHGLSPEQIAVGNGSTELIYLLPRLQQNPRWRRALIVAPPFAEYARALQRDGWHVDYFMLSADDCFALQLDRLQHRLQAGYDLLVLANPGNPTGRLYLSAEIDRLAAAAAAANVLPVVDEAFMDFCPAASAIPLISKYPQLLILRSLTKFHAIPGLRLGFAVAAPAVAARLTQLREPWSINVLAQAAGLAALAAAEHHTATLQLIRQEREALMGELSRIQGLTVFPGAANYLLVQLPDGIRGSYTAARMVEERVLIRPCGNFPGLDDSFVRVAVRLHHENSRLATVLARVVASGV